MDTGTFHLSAIVILRDHFTLRVVLIFLARWLQFLRNCRKWTTLSQGLLLKEIKIVQRRVWEDLSSYLIDGNSITCSICELATSKMFSIIAWGKGEVNLNKIRKIRILLVKRSVCWEWRTIDVGNKYVSSIHHDLESSSEIPCMTAV